METALYTTEIEITKDKFYKYNLLIQMRIYRLPLVIALEMAVVLFLAFIVPVPSLKESFILVAFLTLVFICILYWLLYQQAYKKMLRMQGMHYRITFGSVHLEQEGISGTLKLPYEKIYRIIETDHHFYIMLSKSNGIIIQKDNCSAELAQFIKDRCQRKKIKRRVCG